MEGHSCEDMEGPNIIEEGICVDFGNKKELDISTKMMEIMNNPKVDLESIKEDNEKLLKDKTEQEEINEILLKSLT